MDYRSLYAAISEEQCCEVILQTELHRDDIGPCLMASIHLTSRATVSTADSHAQSPTSVNIIQHAMLCQPQSLNASCNIIVYPSRNSTMTVPFFSPACSIVSSSTSTRFFCIKTSSNAIPSFPSSGLAFSHS